MIFLQITGYLNTRKSLPICICSKGLAKMWPSYTFHFFTRIITSTHTKVFNILFESYMSRFPPVNFQLLIMSKCLVQRISTKVSFKITDKKRHVYIDIGWPWLWNQCFYLGIWNDDRTKIIVFPSFQLVTRLNSQNTNLTEFINEQLHINLFMNIGISIGIIENSTSRKYFFWLCFSSLYDYRHPSTWNPLYIPRGAKWDDVNKVLFSSSKCEKRKSA